MKKFNRTLAGYFSFSRGEKRGSIILIGLIFGINLLRCILPGSQKLDARSSEALENELLQFRRSMTRAADGTSYQKGDPQSNRFTIELNGADTLDLQRLPGIGPSYARRITGYREKLGGYIKIDQLLEVYGMDSARFHAIRKYLTADSSRIRLMNLNTISFKELISHPYMPFELAKEIALFRKKHRGIHGIGELAGMKGADSATLCRLKKYICFN